MTFNSKDNNLSQSDSVFSNPQSIKDYDKDLWDSFEKEANRQEDHIELIASENYASNRILEAQGSLLTNKYAEGYPSKRYYGVVNLLILLKKLQSKERRSYLKLIMLTFNRTLVLLQMLLHF